MRYLKLQNGLSRSLELLFLHLFYKVMGHVLSSSELIFAPLLYSAVLFSSVSGLLAFDSRHLALGVAPKVKGNLILSTLFLFVFGAKAIKYLT